MYSAQIVVGTGSVEEVGVNTKHNGVFLEVLKDIRSFKEVESE